MASTAYLLGLSNAELYPVIWQYICAADGIYKSFEDFLLLRRDGSKDFELLWQWIDTEKKWHEWATQNSEALLGFTKLLAMLWGDDPNHEIDPGDYDALRSAVQFFSAKEGDRRPPLAKTLCHHKVQMQYPIARLIHEGSPKLADVLLAGTGLGVIAGREFSYRKLQYKLTAAVTEGCRYRFA